MDSTLQRVIASLAVAAGLYFLVRGTRRAVRHLRRRGTWRHDTASVVAVRRYRDSEGSRWSWVLERPGIGGTTHRHETPTFNFLTRRKLPFAAPVLVDPDDESSFVLDRGLRTHLVQGLLETALGLIVTAVGIAFLLASAH